MHAKWKENWQEAREHFIDWWNHDGLVVAGWSASYLGEPREILPDPPKPSRDELHSNAAMRAEVNHHHMAHACFPLDILPMPGTNSGPGSVAAYLGSTPEFAKETVWFHPTMKDSDEPESLPPLTLDPNNKWWVYAQDLMRESVKRAKDNYLVPLPDLIEHVDILSSLRDPQTVLFDMIERPEWVEEKLQEITDLWEVVFNTLYDIVKDDEGGNAFCAFHVWGPGKTAKVQCDASAMFSPAMFKRFVVPYQTQQCRFLDYSIFHLDGHQCIPHLDLLLEIDELDAIEWTPDPMVPSGGSPEWYDMYKRILDAGKSVQAIGIQHDEIVPLLDTVGPKGLYIMTRISSEAEAEKIAKMIEPYR